MGAGQQAMFMINPFVFGGGGGPVPTDLSGLELWLPVASIVGLNDGDLITTWPDQSGNTRNATGVGSSSKKPRYNTSGGPNSGARVRLTITSVDGQRYFTLADFLTGFTSGEAFVVAIL